MRPVSCLRTVAQLSLRWRDSEHLPRKAGVRLEIGGPVFGVAARRVLAEKVVPLPVGYRSNGPRHEVAAAVRFLADPTASFITAQQIVVDGGNSLPEDRSWRPSH